MLTTRIFRPTMMAGIVYAREVGSPGPMQSIGGIEELTLAIDEQKIVQANTSSSGGGNRAVVYRINEMTMTAKLQDLNPVNLARSLRATHTEVAASTVTDELGLAKPGGLTRTVHLAPTTVVVRNEATSTVIAAATNYEVRTEGIFWYDDSPALAAALADWETANPTLDPEDWPGLEIEMDYAYGGYDLLQALTRAAPILEMTYAGVNEALEDAPSVVDLFRVQLSATQGLNLISAGAFATLDIAGEVLQDSTKSGAGISKYFRKLMQTPA
ncbi:MAG: hypothetical protein ACK40L_09940 [Hydrogenophaga sp.]